MGEVSVNGTVTRREDTIANLEAMLAGCEL